MSREFKPGDVGEIHRALRYFIDGTEVTEDEAVQAERESRVEVCRGGSGCVPKVLQQPNETREQWLSPWVSLRSTRPAPTTSREADDE